MTMWRSLLGVAVAAAIVAGPVAQPVHTAGGTAHMAARLAELARTADPTASPILNGARAELARARLARADDFVSRLEAQIELGYELTLAGDTEEGLEHLSAARESAANLGEHAARIQ